MTDGVAGLLRDKTRPSRIPPLEAEVAARVVAAHADRSAWRDDALDRGRHGQAPGHQRQFGATHLAQTWLAAASDAPVQAVQRPAVRRQAARHRRALCRSAGACRRSLDRRKEPDPGARSHSARPADEEGSLRHHDARLHQAWHHHAVCRSQRAGRQGDRPLHAAASPSGVHPLPQRDRGSRAGRQTRSMPLPTTTPPTSIPRFVQWLARHPRWTFHFTPTSASWLNAVEGYFAKLTKRRLKRGVFRSIVELQAAIKRFLAETNADPRPFRWTKDPDKIIAAVKRGHQVLDSIH